MRMKPGTFGPIVKFRKYFVLSTIGYGRVRIVDALRQYRGVVVFLSVSVLGWGIILLLSSGSVGQLSIQPPRLLLAPSDLWARDGLHPFVAPPTLNESQIRPINRAKYSPSVAASENQPRPVDAAVIHLSEISLLRLGTDKGSGSGNRRTSTSSIPDLPQIGHQPRPYGGVPHLSIPQTGVVWSKNTRGAFLWTSPSGAITAGLSNGTVVKFLGEQSGYGNMAWVKVEVGEQLGWILETQVSRLNSAPIKYVRADGWVYLRDGPHGGLVGYLSAGAPIMNILDSQQSGGLAWVQVGTMDGSVGWVSAEQVTDQPDQILDSSEPSGSPAGLWSPTSEIDSSDPGRIEVDRGEFDRPNPTIQLSNNSINESQIRPNPF